MNESMLFQLATERKPLTTVPAYMLFLISMGVFVAGKSARGVAFFPTYIADTFVMILLMVVIDRLPTRIYTITWFTLEFAYPFELMQAMVSDIQLALGTG